ncbi:MAG: hypothetical protein QNL04_11335 [SAR324 cluster bacterium]|nr:hypothetical protein [SAR324 cluster bacterium]
MTETTWTLEELRLGLFCGLLIEVIDWGITEEEELTCQAFIKDRWHDEWGSALDFYASEFEKIKEFTTIRATLDEKLNVLLQEVKHTLSNIQKTELLDFIINIADADQEMAPQEDAIIKKFRVALAMG